MGDVALSAHAISRYRERVKPALDDQGARTELQQLLEIAEGEPSTRPPEWLAEGEVEAYLPLTDQICLVVIGKTGGWRAVTCLVANSLSPEGRAFRNRLRKARKRRARMKPRPGRPRDAADRG